MIRAITISSLFKVPIKLHWSFILMPMYVLFVGWYEEMSWISTFWFMIYLVLLFLAVVLHEYGHILTARRYGIRTRDVILTPIGGIARMESMPKKPKNELFVSIAGPLVNLAVAIVLSPALFFFPFSELAEIRDLDELFFGPRYFLQIFILANLAMLVFNLLPAFPLDGGRVLRAILSSKLGKPKGTRYAAIVGQLMAVGMMVYGVYWSGYALILIGVFVFVTATSENRTINRPKVQSPTKSNNNPIPTDSLPRD